MRLTKKTLKMYSDTICTLAHKIIEQVISFIIFFFSQDEEEGHEDYSDVQVKVAFSYWAVY